MAPKARAKDILVHHVQDEVVVYDRHRKVAHRLNPTAARVWSSLDGHRSTQDVAKQLGCDQSVVEMALDQLVAADLLDNAGALSVTRRAALRKMASAAAVGALVTSIPAPLAVAGQSGPSNGQPGDMEAT